MTIVDESKPWELSLKNTREGDYYDARLDNNTAEGIFDLLFSAEGTTINQGREPDEYDNVNHPKHYNKGTYECIDVMEDIWGKEEVAIFCKLSAFKYVWRINEKNSEVNDAGKAAWYMNEYQKLRGVR